MDPVFSPGMVLPERLPRAEFISVEPEDVVPVLVDPEDPVLVSMPQDQGDHINISPVFVLDPENSRVVPVDISTIPDSVVTVDTGVLVVPVFISVLLEEVIMTSSVHASSVKDIVMIILSFCVPEYS